MTQPAKPYTITTHWHPGNEPVTDTAPDWPTARTMALKLTTLAGTAAVVVRDPDGELIANWDAYSNLWREPRPRPTINPTTVDRARTLATEYRDNPTPARAHNAAQTLSAVLDQLDAALSRIALPAPLCLDEGPLAGDCTPICFLAQGHSGAHSTNAYPNPRTWQPSKALGRSLIPGEVEYSFGDHSIQTQMDAIEATARTRWADDSNWTAPEICPGFPVAEPHYARAACFLPEGHPGDHDNQPATGPAFGHPIPADQLPHIPAPLCFADGPQLGANTLTCYLPRDHEGDHSTNAHPNPRTWPQLATGGIVTPNATHRIGEGS